MEQKISIKSNIIYNTLFQVFNISFPFITGSYVSRTVGAHNLGDINFVQSVIAIVMVISNIGVLFYGMREVAKIRENLELLSKLVSEIVILRLIITIIVILIFLPMIYLIPKFNQNITLFYIIGFSIVINIFEVDWFFGGVEDYKIISMRNIITKALTFLFIILFVKEEKDYYIYATLLILGQGISTLMSFSYFCKLINFKIIGISPFKHLKVLKIFFFSTLIVSIYNSVNTIILGFFQSSDEVAFFIRSKQFQLMGLALTGAISTVLIPRISYYYHNDSEKYLSLLNNSLNYNYIISIPIVIGLLILSKPLNLLFGGEQFLPATYSLYILAPLIFFMGLSNWIYAQILLPSGQEKFGLKIQTLSAFINIILNFLLIPKFGYIGAAISLFFTEIIAPLFSIYILKKNFKIKLITNSLIKYIIASSVMGAILFPMHLYFSSFTLILFSSITGAIIYFSVLLILKEKIIIQVFQEFVIYLLKKTKK